MGCLPDAQVVLFIMTKEENEIADFILGLFTSTSIYQDDVYCALNDKYGYTHEPDPRLVVEILKDRGIIRNNGEAYFMLTEYGESYVEKKQHKRKPTPQNSESERKRLYYMMHSPKEEARNRAEKKKKRNERIVFACEVIGAIIAILTFLLTYILPRLI